MRKVNRNPDGTEEVLEGDPEELRRYEQLEPKTEEQQPITEAPKKPGILHGREIDGVPVTDEEEQAAIEWVRTLRKLGDGKNPFSPLPQEPSPWLDPNRPYRFGGPIWVVSCSMCGRIGCQGNCWPSRYTITWGPTLSATVRSSDRVSLLLQEDGTSKPSRSLADVLAGLASVEVKTNGN